MLGGPRVGAVVARAAGLKKRAPILSTPASIGLATRDVCPIANGLCGYAVELIAPLAAVVIRLTVAIVRDAASFVTGILGSPRVGAVVARAAGLEERAGIG